MEWFSCTSLFLRLHWLVDIEFLSVHTSRFETIADSGTALCWFWSSHLPTYLDNFLMFYWHICLYISLLLKYWFNPMVAICCFSFLDYNYPLIMTHFCSNESISNIDFRTLVKYLYLAHFTTRIFFLMFDNIDTLFEVEEVCMN